MKALFSLSCCAILHRFKNSLSSPSQSFVYLIISFQAKVNFAARSYDSEDENMGRKKGRPFETGPCSRAPVYSKGDIREQVRLPRGRSFESERIATAPNVSSHLPGKCRQWLSSQKQLPRPTKKKETLTRLPIYVTRAFQPSRANQPLRR